MRAAVYSKCEELEQLDARFRFVVVKVFKIYIYIYCFICRLGADNAFPPGQVLKEYCRAEAMGDITGV
jgi:hypothetical protein